MSIRFENVHGLIMEAVQDVFKEKLHKKPRFLRSLFTPSTTASTIVSVETVREVSLIAKDRVRGGGANMNRADRSTIRKYETPYYDESFNMTENDNYTRLVGNPGILSEDLLDDIVNDTAEQALKLQLKIERAYEKLCSEAIYSRSVTTLNHDVIDFNPKAESTIAADANGGVWSDTASDIIKSIEKQCRFVSTVGNALGGTFNLLADGTTMEQIKNNLAIQKRADLRHMKLIDVSLPEYISTSGASYHGLLSAGSYQVHLWSYDSIYNDGSSNQPYLPAGKAAIFPMEENNLKFRYAGVSMKDTELNIYRPLKGEWHMRMLNDDQGQSTNFEVKSAGLPVPYAVDQIAIINTLV